MKKTIKLIIIFIISLTIGTKNIKAKELSKVFLEGNIEEIKDKKEERKITIRYISNDLEFEAYATLKLQGNSSLNYDKKNYTIKLYEDNKYSNKKNIEFKENWGKQNKYYLKANWIDKTHSRNIVTANIVADIEKKYTLFMDSPNNGSIDGFPVEVYLNDEFLGLYTWNIPKDNWTFNMDKDNPNHIVFAGETYNDSTSFKETATFTNWELEVGPETDETLEKFNRLITFIKDSTDTEFKNKFHEYLDLDATLNYYVMLNTAKLTDNVSKNLLLITYDGTIWYPVLYDLDTSWGTDWKGLSLTDYKEEITNYFNYNILWKKLLKNFPNEIANRYFELRKENLKETTILNRFNKFYNTIPTNTLAKEKEKWGENIPGYDLSQIEEFLNTRIPLIDHEMYKLYDITAQINIEYSTQKSTLKPVTVTITPNRNDIIITKNGKKSYDYTYTFKDNGEYTFEYEDWYGNYLGTITIKIDCIKTKIITHIIIPIILIIFGITIYIASKKKKEIISKNKDNIDSSKKETNSNSQKTTKIKKTKKYKKTK